jgi:cytoskeletal protein CcmA (bactofilin family)
MDGGSLIARDARVGGQIDTSGHLVVSGRVEGAIRAGGDVTVERGGVVVAPGEVRAWRIRIEGTVIGNVIARDRVEVAAGARVVGDLCAPSIELDADAQLEGRIDRRLPDAEELPGAEAPARAPVRVGQPLRRPARPPTPTPPPAAGAGEQARPVPEPPRPGARPVMRRRETSPPSDGGDEDS